MLKCIASYWFALSEGLTYSLPFFSCFFPPNILWHSIILPGCPNSVKWICYWGKRNLRRENPSEEVEIDQIFLLLFMICKILLPLLPLSFQFDLQIKVLPPIFFRQNRVKPEFPCRYSEKENSLRAAKWQHR